MAFFRRAAPAPEAAPERPKFSALGDAERDWMAGHLEVVDEFRVNLDHADDVAELYDYFLGIRADDEFVNRINPTLCINILGTVFGTHLTRRTTLAWAIATDSHGSELVVYDPRADWLVYPANAIAKSWARGDPGDFIRIMSADIVGRMNSRY